MRSLAEHANKLEVMMVRANRTDDLYLVRSMEAGIHLWFAPPRNSINLSDFLFE